MSKHSAITRFSVALVLWLTSACQGDPSPSGNAPASTPRAAATSAASAAHAPPHAELGSHEDWCDEHQVPESQCTRCNPALVAAFRATGDWCEEHGVPESQCRLCNPELKIERPPKQGSAQ